MLRRDRPVEGVERAAAIILGAGRLVIGAGIWLAPKATTKALGLSEQAVQEEALALGRIAATRDLVLGAGHLAALDDRERLRRATIGVAACDAGDALAFALLARRGYGRAGLIGLSGALPATLLGAWLGRRL